MVPRLLQKLGDDSNTLGVHNEGHSINTQFCTHNLILEDDWNDRSMYPKIIITFHALNHPSHIIKMILRF